MADADRTKWDARYASGDHTGGEPPAWLEELDELPVAGAALDVAAGDGRVAVWMARRGLDVTAVDISPEGLALARDRAARAGVALRTVALDLEREPLPRGPYDVITCFCYRQPELFAAMRERLAPGGYLIAEQPTVRNLERHERPSRRFLAETNELLRAAEGLTVVWYREGWLGDVHRARLVARSPLT